MGANGTLLNAAYKTHTVYQRPAFEPPKEGEAKEEQASRGVVDESNWKEHLGDERSVVHESITNDSLLKP